ILKQDLTYSHKEASLDAQFVNENISKHHLFQIDFLLKNTDSYQSYLNKLEKNDQTKLKLAWKNVQQKLNYNIGDYENLKECFAYKSNGAAQYKTIKKDEKVLSYLQETAKTHFLTLETNDAVKALIIVIEGHAGNIFYDLLITCPNLTEEIYHQMSIMKFYEIASSKRLHFLGDINDTNSFKSQGFILKEKIQIHSTKN
ncbi:MAG: hypothetical protein HON90_03405, partial [Halobacteriovoraceae bacterium]|nr:hypothetical protein [Halobacteriovoraceae bacterium]